MYPSPDGGKGDNETLFGGKEESFQATEEPGQLSEEVVRPIVRRIDWRLLPLLNIVYMFCYLDRSNIGNAKLLSLEEDLGITQAGYSWGLSIFFIGYILFEVPSNMMLKRSRPSRWLSFIIITWGSFCVLMAANSGTASLLVIRFLLGAAEAGFFPGVVFFLTLWYKRSEMCTRLAIFYGASSMAGVTGGLLAYAMHGMNGVAGLAAWRWLFIIEGVPTVLLGVLVYFCLADSPSSVKWLTPEEKAVTLARLQVTAVNVVEPPGVQWAEVRSTYADYKTYLYGLIQIGMAIPTYSMAFLLPTVINSLGFSSVTAQLLTAPVYFFAALFCVALALHSDRRQERAYHVAFSCALGILGLVLISFVRNQVAQYLVLLLVVAGVNGCHAVNLAWATNNSLGRTRAAVISATTIALGNFGGIIAGQIHMGNSVCLFVCGASAVMLKHILARENRRRDLDDIGSLSVPGSASDSDSDLESLSESPPLYRPSRSNNIVGR
ncbi:major facilitator superfamily domain-containing protein [Dimargaris cristalligena]|uniref:Major facilitator superfamily domain-containing protein n=1 Tax=Dimargaris cristalligena TaxID=215637 RepID=A0A4Q0A0D6_9FUNG|nr:major facilitator superfamily domain-containing protein [Dimargaris cristalligena]|eukprot:RKP39457.1 major facilitator superfamily domain-containing protein [Dimargaris cristalligena]